MCAGDVGMKCLLCIHYDVVQLECEYWKEKLKLESYPSDPFATCSEFKPATAENKLEKYKHDERIRLNIDIGIGDML